MPVTAVVTAPPAVAPPLLPAVAPARATKRARKSIAEPKKPATALDFYVSHRKSALVASGVDLALVTAMCREEWTALTEAERAPFEEDERVDYVRYEEEMSTYVPAAVDPHMVTKLGRLKKDPQRPKHPHSAYFYCAPRRLDPSTLDSCGPAGWRMVCCAACSPNGRWIETRLRRP
jgi:hypothetical protein